jgi:hypothetical protein
MPPVGRALRRCRAWALREVPARAHQRSSNTREQQVVQRCTGARPRCVDCPAQRRRRSRRLRRQGTIGASAEASATISSDKPSGAGGRVRLETSRPTALLAPFALAQPGHGALTGGIHQR